VKRCYNDVLIVCKGRFSTCGGFLFDCNMFSLEYTDKPNSHVYNIMIVAFYLSNFSLSGLGDLVPRFLLFQCQRRAPLCLRAGDFTVVSRIAMIGWPPDPPF
jgi:hypothetical protein